MVRLNFSHGSQADHAKRVQAVRAVSQKTGKPIGISLICKAPNIVLALSRTALSRRGQEFIFTLDEVEGDNQRVHLPHEDIFRVITGRQF